MRRLTLEDMIRAAEALRAVPSGTRAEVMLGWLERAHIVDKARKKGVYRGAGDLASVLPVRRSVAVLQARGEDMECLGVVVGTVTMWRAQRRKR